MTGFALLLLAASAAFALARWLAFPTAPFLILGGFAVARLGLVQADLLRDSLVLGLSFVLFVTGLELDPLRFRAHRRTALRVGLVQFVVLGVLGWLAARGLGFDLLTSVYLGLALTVSSTLVTVRLLQRRTQLFEPFGRLVVGVLLVQDLLVILLIPLLTHALDGWEAVGTSFLLTAALVGFAFVTMRWGAPLLQRVDSDEETLLLAALAVLFVFIGLAHLLALPLAAGAFLAGVTLSPFPIRGIVRGQLGSVSDFFTAIFFLALGGLVAPPSGVQLAQAAIFALVVITVTPPLVTLLGERAGLSARPSIEAGLLLSQTSELSLVVMLHGLALGQIGSDAFTVVALVTVFTMVLTPYLTGKPVVDALLRIHPVRREVHGIGEPADHVLLLGCGSGGLPLLETLLASGEDVVVIDDDPEIIHWLREAGVPCIRGDASDPETLRRAGATRARLISSTIRRPRDNEGLLELVSGVPTLVRVFENEDAEWVRRRGGTPVVYSEAAAEEFMRWFVRSELATTGGQGG
jgi:Kef-type K+ transport system membrane component KefB